MFIVYLMCSVLFILYVVIWQLIAAYAWVVRREAHAVVTAISSSKICSNGVQGKYAKTIVIK